MTADKRAQVISEARSWVGTPFRHQAAFKGVGVDCAKLVYEVGIAAGVLARDEIKWSAYAHYSRLPSPSHMGAAILRFLFPIVAADAREGDVLWLEWRENMPMHLAIVAMHEGRHKLIHATEAIGRVVEHELSSDWRTKINSAWRYPGLMS
jgi:NlpC/P60 family putative phage cell wall peptidase